MKLVIFDFDGTLVELKADWDKIRSELYEYFRGLGVEAEFRPIRNTVEWAAGKVSDTGAALAKAQEIIEKEELVGAEKSAVIVKREVLEKLGGGGFRMVVLSKNCRACIERAFEIHGIGGFFNRIISWGDAKTKPHPDGIESAVEEAKHDKGNVWMVGDSGDDVQAAQAAGVNFVGVLTGQLDREGFAKLGVKHIIPDVNEICSILGC